MDLNSIKKLNIPTAPGVYQLKNAKGEIIYIGKAANLKSRVLSYWQKSANHSPIKNKMMAKISKIKWIETDSEIEALLLESNLIKKYQPYYNILLRDDKRFAYIKISVEDEIPGVFVTRKIDRSGRYFGPFTSTLAARETLRAIRKIFPYCTMRYQRTKPCFYYHVGRCLGICTGIISREDYLKRVIKPMILFFEGKKKQIIKNYELRIKNLEKKCNTDNCTEEVVRLRYELKNMKQVLESAGILSVGEKYANDVVELAKMLNLPRVPERIEGYDISNIFGHEAVGSMVVFADGEPNKNEYRKFKIKVHPAYIKTTTGKYGDVQMLQQVLTRRFNNDWPLPDLIIVDGGKAQLNTAARILKQQQLEIPVIAIVKGVGLRSAIAPDKLFFIGEKKPLELPLASPVLHLIKRVRDEAHRFAIDYHRKLRRVI